MKTKLYTALAVALLGISATSCSDGGYWDEASFGKATYAFPKPVYTVTVPEGQKVPASFEVVMTRNNSGAEATVPVVATFSNPLLSGASEVTFAAGSNTAVYTINVADNITGGTSDVTIKIANDYYSQVDNIHNECVFTLNTPYKWESAGKAEVESDWAQNVGYPVEVPVQHATDYTGEGSLYRLQSLYYYLEPDYAEEGYGIQFVLNDDFTPNSVFPQFQLMGEENDSVGDLAFGWWSNGDNGSLFEQDGNTYLICGQVCARVGSETWSPVGYPEMIKFTWTPPTAGN